MKVRWTKPALHDLEEVGTHIARRNPEAACEIANRIVELTGLLSEHPEAGRPGRAPHTRELVIADTPYVVPYRVSNNEIELLAAFMVPAAGPTRSSN